MNGLAFWFLFLSSKPFHWLAGTLNRMAIHSMKASDSLLESARRRIDK